MLLLITAGSFTSANIGVDQPIVRTRHSNAKKRQDFICLIFIFNDQQQSAKKIRASRKRITHFKQSFLRVLK